MTLKLNKISILVIEDNLPMRKLVNAVLQSLGVTKIYFAGDGEQGYNEYKQHHPDIILTDWLMEPVNGTEFVRMVRTLPDSPNRVVPIIMMTGYNASARVLQARDEGVTEFLIKPFTAADLAKRIAYVINRPRDFIINAESYSGPDRRRKVLSHYNTGADRRLAGKATELADVYEIDFAPNDASAGK